MVLLLGLALALEEARPLCLGVPWTSFHEKENYVDAEGSPGAGDHLHSRAAQVIRVLEKQQANGMLFVGCWLEAAPVVCQRCPRKNPAPLPQPPME